MSIFKKSSILPIYESKAKVVSPKRLEITAKDGEKFEIMSSIGSYTDEKTRLSMLNLLEGIFDRNFSEDKEEMVSNVWREAVASGIHILGIQSGTREQDRIRIGSRIRQIREQRGLEAREVAHLAGITPANLSRIENGKYSVGLDILSKIAAALGMKIDLVDLD